MGVIHFVFAVPWILIPDDYGYCYYDVDNDDDNKNTDNGKTITTKTITTKTTTTKKIMTKTIKTKTTMLKMTTTKNTLIKIICVQKLRKNYLCCYLQTSRDLVSPVCQLVYLLG